MSFNPVVVAPLSRLHIEAVAMQWRRHLGYPDDGMVRMLSVIEHQLPLAVQDFWYEIVPDHELGDAEATTLGMARCIRISQTCYDAARMRQPRPQFTLAHELGHLILHTGQPLEFARGSVKAYRDPEWQADSFAGSFLVPAEAAQRCLSVDEIAARFGVSKAAANVRATQLGLPYAEKKGRGMSHAP